jgi:hypothetical protein
MSSPLSAVTTTGQAETATVFLLRGKSSDLFSTATQSPFMSTLNTVPLGIIIGYTTTAQNDAPRVKIFLNQG